VSYPLTSENDGIKMKPELMATDKLYHCIFQDKVMLVFKDNMEMLNCYEIEEKELVEKVKSCSNPDDVEKIFEDYIKKENLKN
jgi:hypothetical protein